MREAIHMTSFGCKLFIALSIFQSSGILSGDWLPCAHGLIFFQITVFQTVHRNDIYNYDAPVKDIHATIADLQ